ncbi:DUF2735 domain-containing protein [Ancylobacter amanitiformis]|uniref:DUF2735 domain-containing protein n=1 Tax=Ancylobacter amanitiformis TaxID=217069 RepID=A0ABU0LSV2_9HYPH|nr:DUF2735 domain-containing protein [Ancylobacter amanitiformis]MDQ0511781.1 hypothetical protein [Ancylobacter amanitiformis]
MNSPTQRESAQIVQFPTGGRAGLAARQAVARQTAEMPANLASVAFGSWYHEEAMKEERNPKN